MSLLRETQLDPAALYFVSFDGLVNNESFQQDAILTFADYQYTAWYTPDRSAVIARRALPAGAWEKAVLPHRLSTDDSHNVISLGISPTDGRLHVAMDTHNTTVFYVKSEAGLVSAPASRTWSPARFGAVQRNLDGVELGAITYPQFVVTPERRLQLSYRTGGSGNGTNELVEYDGTTWRRLGKWSSATGSWTAPMGSPAPPATCTCTASPTAQAAVDPATSEVLNLVLLVQSKASTLPFTAGTETGLQYTCDENDLNYWLNGNAPVILVLSQTHRSRPYTTANRQPRLPHRDRQPHPRSRSRSMKT